MFLKFEEKKIQHLVTAEKIINQWLQTSLEGNLLEFPFRI